MSTRFWQIVSAAAWMGVLLVAAPAACTIVNVAVD